MRRYVFKLFDHEITMARVLISKATLADFGVPHPSEEVQHYADMRNLYRQNQPTAEDMERIVRESDVALTPQQFSNKVPLIDRREKGFVERFGETGERFGRQMGLEGALAQGLVAHDFPSTLDVDAKNLPFLRDYHSRQSTLPEYDWSYKTKGPYYDEQGNILPGQVPPVDAIKIMGEDDIASMGTREGYGLKPVPFGKINMNWEADMPNTVRFPSENIGFVGNLSQKDIEANTAGNVSPRRGKGAVGIRGFGRPQDKAFARGAVTEGIEGGITAPIPPERLVGVMPNTRMSAEEAENNALKHLYSPKLGYDQKLYQLVDEGKIAPMDAMNTLIRMRAKQIQNPDLRDGPIFGDIYPDLYDLEGTDAGQREQRGNSSVPSRAVSAHELLANEFRGALPLAWQQGVFGLENPLLTEAEKEAYIADINRQERRPTGYNYEADVTNLPPEKLRTLYPKQAGVRFA
jgi:hypothetical protein